MLLNVFLPSTVKALNNHPLKVLIKTPKAFCYCHSNLINKSKRQALSKQLNLDTSLPGVKQLPTISFFLYLLLKNLENLACAVGMFVSFPSLTGLNLVFYKELEGWKENKRLGNFALLPPCLSGEPQEHWSFCSSAWLVPAWVLHIFIHRGKCSPILRLLQGSLLNHGLEACFRLRENKTKKKTPCFVPENNVDSTECLQKASPTELRWPKATICCWILAFARHDAEDWILCLLLETVGKKLLSLPILTISGISLKPPAREGSEMKLRKRIH